MTEFLRKTYNSAAAFEEAVGLYGATQSPERLSLYIDDFDDGVLNTIMTNSFGAPDTAIELNNVLICTKNYAPAGTAIIYTNIYPKTYDISYELNVNVFVGTTNFYLFRIASYGNPKAAATVDSSGNYIFIHYRSGTAYYWNGSIWTTTPSAAYAGALLTDYKIRIEKTTANYIWTLYSATGTVLATASEAISTIEIDATYYDDVFGFGSYSGVGTFLLYVRKLRGIYCDKMANLPGNWISLFDVGGLPPTKGRYREVLDDTGADVAYYPRYWGGTKTLRDIANRTKLAQGFIMGKYATIKTVKAGVYRASLGPPTSNYIWAEIWTDDGTGKPGAMIPGYRSNNVLISTLQLQRPRFVDFTFSSRVFLTAGTKYHIVFNGSYAIGAAPLIELEGGTPSPSYPAGGYSYFDGSAWTLSADVIFHIIQYAGTSGVRRHIASGQYADYKIITSKTDWEGNSQVASNIDTATFPGAVVLSGGPSSYAASGYIQNVYDLGRTPTLVAKLTARYQDRLNSWLTFKVEGSNDGITWSPQTTVVLTKGEASLASVNGGIWRFFRVKVEFTSNQVDITAYLFAIGIDAFGDYSEIDSRLQLPRGQYSKTKIEMSTASPLLSPVASYLDYSYRVAYELYIKSVKYKISSEGIIADMELSSQI